MRDSREGTKPKNIHVRNRTHASRHEKYTQRHVLIMSMIPVPTHILHATVQMVQQIGSTYQERAWRTVGHHCVHKGQCGTRRRRRDNDVHDGDCRREEEDRRWLHRTRQGGGVPIGYTAPETDLLSN